MGRRPRQRIAAGRPPAVVVDDRRRSGEAHRLRRSRGRGHRDALAHVVPEEHRGRAGHALGARVRRRHRAVVVGPRQRARPRHLDSRSGDPAGDGESVRRHERAARHDSIGSRRGEPVDRHRCAGRHGHLARRRRHRRTGRSRHHLGDRRRRRRQGRGRRSLARRRYDLARRQGSDELDLRVAAAGNRPDRHQEPRDRRQRQRRRHVGVGRRERRSEQLPVHQPVEPRHDGSGRD